MENVCMETTVKKLKQLLTLDFGGKEKGRYKISYERLKQLASKTILHDDFVASLNQACLEVGIYLINLGHEFAIIETSILFGYRNVPQGVIEKIMKEK